MTSLLATGTLLGAAQPALPARGFSPSPGNVVAFRATAGAAAPEATRPVVVVDVTIRPASVPDPVDGPVAAPVPGPGLPGQRLDIRV